MKISTKEYVEERIQLLTKYYDAEITAIRRAVDKYSDTNDEWKSLHNGLQRQMERERAEYQISQQEERAHFFKKDEVERLIKILLLIAGFCISLALFLRK